MGRDMLFRSCAIAATLLLLSACASGPIPQKTRPPAPATKATPPVALPPPKSAPAAPAASTPADAPANPGFARPAPELVAEINALWKAFPGRTGIAIRRIDGQWTLSERGNEMFPQQSVSKLWVAMAWLDAVDRGKAREDAQIRIGPEDLTLFHQPIAAEVRRNGSIEAAAISLVDAAIVTSDNTANDSVMRSIGGPDAVRAFLDRKAIRGVRFGPGERLLQSGIAGLTWTQAMSQGRSFQAEREKLPEWLRRKALESYVADPVDGATPVAIVEALDRLARGELLSARSTRQLMDMLERVESGPQRLKAGVPPGWRIGHKTGTGQVLGPVGTGYNDVGIITAPDGTRYAVAVMLASTTASVPERMALMQSVSRALATWHNK